MSVRRDESLTDELGRDFELAESLRCLDPESEDPNYWLRFRGWVMENAAAELGRRRLMARITVGDVMTSWARTVVPTAMLAAAVAGLVLLRGHSIQSPDPISDELLVSEIEGAAVPVAPAAEAVVFASEAF